MKNCKACTKRDKLASHDIWIHSGRGLLEKDFKIGLRHCPAFEERKLEMGIGYKPKRGSCVWFSHGSWVIDPYFDTPCEEHADCFDFGIGDEAYKYRFATRVPHLHTWGLYPSSLPAAKESAP